MVYLQRVIFRFLGLCLLITHLKISSLQKQARLLITKHRPYQSTKQASYSEITRSPKKEEIVIPPCPSSKDDQRVGDFRNDKTVRTCHRP